MPLLRQRSVLLTVALVENDQVRVNVMPKKMADGENTALTTPMSFTGTAAELDEQLPAAISSFVASHLQLKNTLTRAKEEMDAAAKAAQEEARNKAKHPKKPLNDRTKEVEPVAKQESKKEPEPPRPRSLFDAPADAQPAIAAASPSTVESEEDEILTEIAEDDTDDNDRDDEAA
ncbi:MAG TPA: PRTRC system protein E [Bryobacteraceae bacterium]|nr:PRTRC system protein E [Bryobacteraceae bacterium]